MPRPKPDNSAQESLTLELLPQKEGKPDFIRFPVPYELLPSIIIAGGLDFGPASDSLSHWPFRRAFPFGFPFAFTSSHGGAMLSPRL